MMKKFSSLLPFALIFLVSFMASCGKDNDSGTDEPLGTIAVNMMNEDNGKTVLGNSDVYIDNANNFHGLHTSMASLGKKDGLGEYAPLLDGLADKVAVEPGYAYQIFRDNALEQFPSGKLALNITGDFYNVYVVSPIKKDDVVVGANVRYALADVPDYDLPEYNKNIGTFHYRGSGTHELTINLPSPDFEVMPQFAGSDYYKLEYEKINNKLVVTLVDFYKSDVFGFYIRIHGSYTYIWGEVQF